MPPIKPILDSKSPSQADFTAAAKTRLEIIEQRRFAWRLNYRLLWISVAVLGLFLVACIVSYRHNSNRTADTFFSQAEQAAADGRYAEQATWLNRYSLLRPNDIDAIVDTALAANSAADSAELELQPFAVDQARKYLNEAIRRLGGEQHLEKKTELRKLLINRLLQLGGIRFCEAEREVIRLNSDADDPQACKWMSLALVGQVQSNFYADRSSNEEDKDEEYWTDLSNQKPGKVLQTAIDLNPTDLYLLEKLVGLFAEHPDQLDEQGGNEQPAESLEQRVENRLARIAENSDSRSHLIRYLFDWSRAEAITDVAIAKEITDEAIKTLTAVSVSEQAALRLEELSAADSESESTKGSIAAFVVGEGPAELWDFTLLAEVARLVSDKDDPKLARWFDPELARRYFEVLTSVRPVGVSETLRETIYLLSGRLAFAQGDRPKAIDIWKLGLEDVNPNSIRLHGAIARLFVEPGGPWTEQSADEAEVAVGRFRDSVQMARRRLAVAPEGEMMRASRAALVRDIETAEWRMNILDAILNARSGTTQNAIDILELAINAPAKIDDTERIEAARLLASLHKQSGAWDSAALALERAVDLAPGDAGLRVQLATAWEGAGNQARASKQWEFVDKSDSIMPQAVNLEAQFNRQLRELPEDQDFSALRSAISSLREKINQAPSIDLTENERTGLQQAISRLDLLEITLPPSGQSFNQYLDSPEMAGAIAKLAEQRPEDVQIQEFAARRLAVAGDIVKSDEALARLEKLLGESSTPVVKIRAGVFATQGKIGEACQILLEQAGKDPAESETLRQTAASIALQAGDLDLAYQALEEIQESNLSPATLFTLTRIARQLPAISKIVLDQKLSPNELSDQWKSKLKKREGDKGTYWRFLDAADSIQQIRNHLPELTLDDPLQAKALTDARSLVQDLLSIRPSWGEAISLEGWLFAIEGKHDQAIEQLQNGIDAGDTRLTTRQLLLEQLWAAEEYEEAEKVLAEMSSRLPGEQNSAMQIQLALKQNDFKGSLGIARDAVKERPNDLIPNIILARVAIVAAQDPAATPEERNERFNEAQDAISKAEEVSEGDNFVVLAAALFLQLAKDDQVAVRQQIERINASQLGEFERLILMSRGLVAIKDAKEALTLLKRVDELRPSSQSQLDLANVYRQLNQPDQEIAALRKAQQLDSENPELRNRLVQALMTRDGNDVNWSEIKELLQGAGDAKETNNRLQYAMLLGAHGDKKQLTKAEEILNEVIDERNSNSNDAKRILAVLLLKPIPKNDGSSSDNPLDAKVIEDIKSLYADLTRLPQPEVADLYRYADLLLIHGQPDDLDRVARLLDKLKRSEGGTLAALEISLRLAEKTGRRDESPQIVRQWADREKENGSLEKYDVFAIAAGSLLKLDFVDQGLQWMEQAYREEPKMLVGYVVALNQADRVDIALAICTEHHQKHADDQSLILLVETVLNSPPEKITPQHRELFDKAVVEKIKNPQPEDALLLEGVATYRMQQQEYEQAVALYDLIDKHAPPRIRTLNNLAMAYSELPGLESRGIEKIQRALKLAENEPALLAELLDTYGVVLLRSGRLEEAEKVFRRAISKNRQEPRFQFHLISTLEKQNKDSEAKDRWRTLDVEKLDPKGLMPRGRKEFEKMKSENLINQSGNEGQITQ